ncbi:MAG: endonuclease III [Candidatus Omnitrophica bacterium]|nr:endonuclease III [Candidatus Omnitrophota bacterium]
MATISAPSRQRIGNILKALEQAYPTATCSLRFSNPLELLIATILSAQCTDVLVNKVTLDLFKKYKTANDYAQAGLPELERDISRVNFYRNKAKSIKLACQTIVERFGGKVPPRMEDLLTLQGVARKTANVVLGNAFGIQAGIIVDTHMMRLSQRLGLTSQTNRDKIEHDLMPLVPQHHWTRFSHQMIEHGRHVCKAKTPLCAQCPIGKALCPSYQA